MEELGAPDGGLWAGLGCANNFCSSSVSSCKNFSRHLCQRLRFLKDVLNIMMRQLPPQDTHKAPLPPGIINIASIPPPPKTTISLALHSLCDYLSSTGMVVSSLSRITQQFSIKFHVN